MTDEERKRLIGKLRNYPQLSSATLQQAADEIERLTKTNERLSNALWAAGVKWEIVEAMTAGAQSDAEPRPDASAGLIEASCLLDKRADENKGKNDLIERAYRMAACFLRARAADRSMT